MYLAIFEKNPRSLDGMFSLIYFSFPPILKINLTIFFQFCILKSYRSSKNLLVPKRYTNQVQVFMVFSHVYLKLQCMDTNFYNSIYWRSFLYETFIINAKFYIIACFSAKYSRPDSGYLVHFKMFLNWTKFTPEKYRTNHWHRC